MNFDFKNQLYSFAAFVFAPVLLFAHPGFGNSTGFVHGFAHPLSGLDHMIAMVAIGIWAVQVGGKATWLIPLSFVSMMIAGAVLGASGIALPFVETGIIMSVLILGVLIIASVRMPVILGMIVAGLFALCHGHSHGTEIPATASGIAFIAGFTLSTVMLHLGGIGLGYTAAKVSKEKLVRLAGIPIFIAGLVMLFM